MKELDLQARTEALDPAQSFIIQAPAGSGKTELLTQRYLSLLSQACESPEEIIAITFTRKAALQMRERVIAALQLAETPEPPPATHRLTTWRLAREVLDKDQQYQWRLLDNPQRLRILTIDALCGQLSSQLPLLSGYGAPARIVEDASPYYQQAVRELIIHSTPVELLTHLDNNTTQLSVLLVELLAKREQWLPYLIYSAAAPQLRHKLEQGLSQLAQEILATLDQQLSSNFKAELFSLLRFAGNNLTAAAQGQSSHPVAAWANLREFPACAALQLETWRGLAHALLTNAGEWRKMVDIRTGFPPKTAEKTAFQTILNTLADNDLLKMHLQQIQLCPPIQYDQAQWQIIEALIATLPLLVAQLQLIFQQQGVMDFIEMGLCASRALGEEQQPTDLALALDYRIRHLLIDEFQDTSLAQFKLLEKLLLGWEADDGRSIFLVGDPMQSIYRFRNAEVGLFLRTIQHGMQNIRLKPLYLSFNFRSGEKLITWFNQIFPQVLAAENNLTTGAIAYKPAAAAQPQLVTPAVSCYASTDAATQAQQVVNIIQHCRNQYPEDKIAVLVRSRSHLLTIVPALHAAHIKFQAIEIEPLAQRSEIQDLAALTRALYHRADRIAWLAVLRAPYCGLTLADLHVIAQASERQTIYESLINFAQLADLSADARQRLQRVTPVLTQALANRGRMPVAEWVESVWLLLGGPAGLTQANELINAQTYFQLLTKLTQEGFVFNRRLLDEKLQNLYAAPDANADPNLQIMTIHKAKGLEFEQVILPGLQHKPAADSSRLFLWMERANAHEGSDLILAPIKAASAESDPMYGYLKAVEQQKLMYEAGRLLYVAATRAKQSLHLLAVLPNVPEIKSWQPPGGSFLHMLWPYFREQLPDTIGDSTAVTAPEATHSLNFQRLTADWQLPQNIAAQFKWPSPSSSGSRVELSIPANFSTSVGTVIHEALADLAQQAPHFQDINLTRWQRRLQQLGVAAQALPKALAIVQQALVNTLQDPRGLWILSTEHQDCKNEYAQTAIIAGQVMHVVMDRTFIDADGVRWIIDYKTGDDQDAAIHSHHDQLTRYAQVMALKEHRPIRLGLYFPVSGTWQEFD